MTTGTVAYKTAPWTMLGIKYFNTNLGDPIDLLKEPHKVTHELVQVFLNKPGNKGLVNKSKIYLHQLGGLLNFIIKNHLHCTSCTSLTTQSVFVYVHMQ